MSEQHSFFCDIPLFILDDSNTILDANRSATFFYGYSREDFQGMTLSDLGTPKERGQLIPSADSDDLANDKIWVQRKKSGEKVFVQFTTHMFNYRGEPCVMAAAHDVSELVVTQETNTKKFPKIARYRGDSPLADIIWDGHRNVKRWTEKAERLFGWTKSDAVGNPDFFEQFIHTDEVDEANRIMREKVEAKDMAFTARGRVYTKSGSVRITEWYNTFVYDESGQLDTVYTLVQDVSEKKEAEHLFKMLSEKSLVGVYLIQDGVFKYVNPRFGQIFGYDKNEIEDTMGPLDLTHPDDREMVEENLRQRFDHEADSMKYDFRCLTKRNDTIHVKVYGARMTYMGKTAVVGTLLDITNSKLAFERYQASIESFEDLFDSISDAIYIQNREGKFIKVNDAAVQLNGYSRDTLIGSSPEKLVAPGKVDPEKTEEYFQRALNGSPQKYEQWSKKKNGEVFPEEVILNPATYFGDDVVIAISRDVSDRYEVKDEIEKSRKKFSQLFQNAPVGIVMMDHRQEIQAVNRAFEEIFGYTQKEIEGLDIDRLIVPQENEEGARGLSGEIFEGHSSSMTATRKRKDGSLVEVIIYGVPVIMNDRTIAIFGIYVDITDRIRAEKKVKKSLKEKEVLLAEIHHRVKNNLAVITGLLELQLYNTQSEEAEEVLRESQLRINSIALIHEKLYQNKNLSEISIDIYLDELIGVIQDSMKVENTDVTISIDAEPVALTINQAIPCGLILNELITNSYKHAFEGRESGQIVIYIREEDQQMLIEFKDDGVGMPEEVSVDVPTSLGLTLLDTLTDQLQGESGFEKTQQGTCFTLRFRKEYPDE